MEGLLIGKSVIVTGAGSGVGRQAAELFARHGARLVCADIRTDLLEETVTAVKSAGGEARAVRCDVSRKAEVVAAVEAAVQAYGRLDVIFNNVGIPSPTTAAGQLAQLAENTEEDIDRLINVNVKGVIFGCQAAIAQFRAQGGGGVIVNTASAAGLMGWGGVLYGSTKGAVVNLTRALAMEVARDGIRVNNINPAGMPTRFVTGDRGPLPEAALDRMGQTHPLGKVIDPLDAAKAALFLASDLSSNITGVNLPVDGGMTAGRSVG
jgi:NAD(P)-dependent dehydrogenase (short-subunit alcohol dehydrogenase family)